jgi:tRNA (guanosine-2'-O-)-methyltransferase
MKKDLQKYLEQFVTRRRTELINKTLDYRTRYITVVLEDIYQSQNASAVLRTCECFGVQDIHIIENKNKYEINPDVALGANKWLNLIKFNKKKNNNKEAINYLREKGYRIIATTPRKNCTLLEDFNLENGKLALLFGTEIKGLSDEVINMADECLKIPMYGFTESFNISVSAAIILNYLISRLRNSDIDWALSEHDKQDIRIQWLKQSIKRSDLLEKAFIYKLDS